MISESDIRLWFQRITEKNILLIGDFMIDKYIYGKVERISPEAPVPVVQVSKSEHRPGGAGNVLMNLHALGARVFPISMLGADEDGKALFHIFESLQTDCSGLFLEKDMKTTSKTRVVAQMHQMLRIDEEEQNQFTEAHRQKILQQVRKCLKENKIDALIFEDYDKGLLSPDLIEEIVAEANALDIPSFVDPKKKNFRAYKGVTVFKPNLKELKEGMSIGIQNADEVPAADALLREALHHRYTLCTLSEAGIYFSTPDAHYFRKSEVRKLADVSGAGDSVIASMACFLISGADPLQSAEIANLAAGIVCESPGVIPIDKERLLQESLRYFLSR